MFASSPEKREEKTTEGGLNLKDSQTFEKIKKSCDELKANHPEGKISLFVEADLEILELCAQCNIDAVEIHTGDYAIDFIAGESMADHFTKFKIASDFIESKGLGFHAGHGLTDESLLPLVQNGLFVEI